MTIGESFTSERENFLNDKYFEIKKLWKSVGMSQEEELWMCLNFIYWPIIDAHYDDKTGQVDTTLAHMELDKVISDLNESIDSSNDRLYIKEDAKK